MGIYRPFVGGIKSVEEYIDEQLDHSHDKAFTPSDALTVSRPVLAAYIARKLLRGEHGVTYPAMVMAATDAEGKVGRGTDKASKRFPFLKGWGTTAHGATWDTYADTSALVIVSTAALFAPRVSAPAKTALSIVLAQEAYKSKWAIQSNNQYMEHINRQRDIASVLFDIGDIDEMPELPSKLEVPASQAGKEAMAEKLTAVAAAVSTNDFQSGLARRALDATALTFATTGALRGEAARRDYVPIVADMIDAAREQALHDEQNLGA